ncbi:efflux RND transporter periplasmic adaptor subunit [Candidatus Hydrogenedentota bacterium]
MKKTVIAGLILIVAITGGIWYMMYRKSIVTIKQSHVIGRGSVMSTVTSSSAGTVVSEREATVSSEYMGRVTEIRHDEGDFIEKDEIVLIFESGSAKATVKLARASLSGGESAHRQAELGEMVAGVVAPAEIEKAEVLFKNTKDVFKKAEELYKKGIWSELVYNKTKAEMEAAEKVLESVKAGDMDKEIKAEQVKHACANVEQLEASVELAEEELKKCAIRAPFSGVMSKKFVETGEIAPLGTPLFHIIDTKNLKIIAPIDEVDVGKLKVGASAEIRLDAHADREFSEKVSKIAPVVTTDLDKSRTVEIEIKVTKSLELYTVGMSADVIVILGSREDVIAIPTNAIFERKGEKLAWVMDGKRVHARSIKLGLQNWDSTEIAAGLEEGEETVLVTGEGTLVDGAPYKMMDDE